MMEPHNKTKNKVYKNELNLKAIKEKNVICC